MATPYSADGTDHKREAPQAILVSFPDVSARERRAVTPGEAGQILFFTGVRYERHAAGPTDKRKPGRRQQGPRRHA
jgi:hypothetical protein